MTNTNSIVIGDSEIANSNLYIYCGATDNLNSIVPDNLELVSSSVEDLLNNGLTWNHKDIYGNGRYAVLAIPSYLNIECTGIESGGFIVNMECNNISEYNNYKFYYFNSPIVGDFTCKYIFKEVK